MQKIEANHSKYLQYFSITVMVSFILWFFKFVVEPDGKQMNLFFLGMGDFLADSSNTTGLVSALDPYHNEAIGLWNAAYPPLAYAFYYVLAHASSTPDLYLAYYVQPVWLMLFMITLCASMIFLYSLIEHQINSVSKDYSCLFALAICFSRPVIYTIERGNIILLALLACGIFIFYYDSENKIKKEIGLLSLAVAAGLKLTPALLGILLLYRKDWYAAVRAVVYGLLLFLLHFLFFKGKMSNLLQLINNIQLHFLAYSPGVGGTGLVGSYAKMMSLFHDGSYNIKLEIQAVLLTVSKLASVLLLVGGFTMKEKWKAVMNVTLALLLLPSVSGSYCTLYMIPCTVLFLKAKCDEHMDASDIVTAFCMLMFYLVYRCALTEFFDFHFAIPVMLFIAVIRSLRCMSSSVYYWIDSKIHKRIVEEQVRHER